MPQQMAIAAINNATAAIAPTFKPKNGTTNNPTSGRVHSQRTRASAILSEWIENFLNMLTSAMRKKSNLFAFQPAHVHAEAHSRKGVKGRAVIHLPWHTLFHILAAGFHVCFGCAMRDATVTISVLSCRRPIRKTACTVVITICIPDRSTSTSTPSSKPESGVTQG